MKKEIHLLDIIPYLMSTHVKLDLNFLKELLKNASKCEYPHKNEHFLKKIGYTSDNKGVYTTIQNWIRGYRTIPFSKLKTIVELSNYSWESVEKHVIWIKAGQHGGEVHIDFPLIIGRELGSIVGHILGDGSIAKPFSQVFYSNSNKELLNEFRDYMYKIFKIEPRIWVQKKKKFEEKSEWLKRVNNIQDIPDKHPVGLFYPKMCGVILHALFGKFAYGKCKTLTEEIINSPQEFKITLLRAFYDDEGSVYDKNQIIKIHQDNKNLLEQVAVLLSGVGIESSPLRYYTKRDKKRYFFNICGYQHYKKFCDVINFTSKLKRKKLKGLVEGIEKRKSYRLRHNETRSNIIDILKYKPLLTKNIQKQLKIRFPIIAWNEATVQKHLKKLYLKKLINRNRFKNSYVWSLNKLDDNICNIL